jgi:hypothetical protein
MHDLVSGLFFGCSQISRVTYNTAAITNHCRISTAATLIFFANLSFVVAGRKRDLRMMAPLCRQLDKSLLIYSPISSTDLVSICLCTYQDHAFHRFLAMCITISGACQKFG